MSLISIRHFIAPIQSKTNLFAIVGVVVLFAAFRMSGGGTNVRINTNKTSSEEYNIPAFHDSSDDSISLDVPGRSVPRSNDPIDDMLKSDNKENSPDTSDSGQEDGGLAEIERQMGLR